MISFFIPIKKKINQPNFYYDVSFKIWDYVFPQLASPDKHIEEKKNILGKESQQAVKELFA